MGVQRQHVRPTESVGGQRSCEAGRRTLIGLLAVIAIGLGIATLASVPSNFRLALPWVDVSAAPFNGGVLSPALELPDFNLQRADGGRFVIADTRGRLSLFFFGYTYCPDVCPLTLGQVALARRQLGASADRVDVYFVTVDPARDTPERLTSFLAKFDPRIVGLTGTPEETERALAAFAALGQKGPAIPGSDFYLVDHTASLFLVDPEQRLRLLYANSTPAAEIAADLHRLVADPAAAAKGEG